MDNINKKIVVALVGITLITYLILSFVTVDFKDEEGGGKYPRIYRHYRLFSDLFKGLGYKLEWHYKSSLPDTDGVILFFDYDDNDQKTIDELARWAREGGILFFVGIDTEKDPITENVILNGPLGDIEINPALSKDVSKISLKRGKYMHETSDEEAKPQNELEHEAFIEEVLVQQELEEQEVFVWYPLLTSSYGTVLYEMDYRKGKIIMLTESSLLSNWQMMNENTAILLNNILKPYYNKKIYLIQRKIFFTRNSYSYKSNSPLQVLFKKPILFATLQIILIGVLFSLWKGSRFGNPLHYDPYARRTLTEHLKAIGQLYRKSKNSGVVGTINKEYFIFRLRKSPGLLKKADAESIIQSTSRRLPEEKAELERLIYSKENLSEFQLLLNESKREEIVTAIRSKSTRKIKKTKGVKK